MQVTETGSVRVDLVGGTLDISPIHLILPEVVTVNVATSLKAKAIIEPSDFDGVEIESLDYDKKYQFKYDDLTLENFDNNKFEEMSFVLQIIHYFDLKNIKVTLSSGAPAGSGLGGSSAMGVTLFKALCKYTETPFDRIKAIKVVQSIESRILNQGVPGYQDYYPALFGGVLALLPSYEKVVVDQLYDVDLIDKLEHCLTLVFSGKSRKSGINNWEVYKGFFDGNASVRAGMVEIAKISHETYEAIKTKNGDKILEGISAEGAQREKLFENIVSPEIKELLADIRKTHPHIGLKMCGAGGGGCFLLVHGPQDADFINDKLAQFKMQKLDFKVEKPIV